MSMSTSVSRMFALLSCMFLSIGFAFVCNLGFGQDKIGFALSSSVLVGLLFGGFVVIVLGIVDFLTHYAGRIKDFLAFNLMGGIAGVTFYNLNAMADQTASTWTFSLALVAVFCGVLCGNIYSLFCLAAKKRIV